MGANWPFLRKEVGAQSRQGHGNDQGGQQVCSIDPLDIGDAEAQGNSHKAADGQEVGEHLRRDQRGDKLAKKETEGQEEALGDDDEGDGVAQSGGEDQRGEDVHGGLGEEDSHVAGDTLVHSAENIRAAGAEGDGADDVEGHIGIVVVVDFEIEVVDPPFKAAFYFGVNIDQLADEGAHDQGKDDGGQTVELEKRIKADTQGTDAEDKVEGLTDAGRQAILYGGSDKAADEDAEAIDKNGDRHIKLVLSNTKLTYANIRRWPMSNSLCRKDSFKFYIVSGLLVGHEAALLLYPQLRGQMAVVADVADSQTSLVVEGKLADGCVVDDVPAHLGKGPAVGVVKEGLDGVAVGDAGKLFALVTA